MKSMNSFNQKWNEWISQNPNLASHIKLISADQFNEKSIKINKPKDFKKAHNKTINDLTSICNNLNHEITAISERIESLCTQQVPKIGELYYDSPQMNMDVRKLFFAEQHLHKIQIQTYNIKYSHLIEFFNKIQKIKQLLQLFVSDNSSQTQNSLLEFENGFFDLNDTDEIKQQLNQIKQLTNYIANLKHKISEYQKPMWFTNLPKYFKKIAKDSLWKFDTDLSYILPQNCEISISRFLFYNNSPLASKVDVIIRSFPNIPASIFVHELLQMCYDLVPPKEYFNDEELAIIVLFFFRVLFDRVYEKFGSMFYRPIDPRMKICEKLREKPMSELHWPTIYFDDDYNNETNKNTSVKDFFKNDIYYSSGSKFLEMTLFCTNPIDILYYCHKALLSTQKGAIIHSLKGKIASHNDVSQVICFDDMFSLMLGIFLASELPDLYSLDWFVRDYSPSDSLSPPFEYAKANFEGLAQHITNLSNGTTISKENT